MSSRALEAHATAPTTAVAAGRRAGWSRLPRWAGAAIGIAVIIGVWTLLALTVMKSSGSVPTPVAVIRAFSDNGVQLYWTNASVTTWSAVQGFFWGDLLAIALAAAVLLAPILEGVATQIAVISYCIPLTAIGPIVLILAEPGSRTTSVFLAGMSVFLTTVVGCLLGLRSADRASLDLVRAYGGGRWAQLRKVQVIAALPHLFAALKLAAPAAFLGAVLGEYFGGVDSGLGVLITSAQTNVDVPQIWALALLSGLIAGVGYLLMGLLGRLVTPWSSGPNRPARGATR